MGKKKNKFDLTSLVSQGYLRDGEEVCFVSDPDQKATVIRILNGEYKLKNADGKLVTVHAFAQDCLGQEPPEHASRWLKTAQGKTLYELWHADDSEERYAA